MNLRRLTEKIVSKTEEAEINFYLIAQAYSWPLFIWSIILGFGSLTVGEYSAHHGLKRLGYSFICGISESNNNQLCSELVSIIINWIKGERRLMRLLPDNEKS